MKQFSHAASIFPVDNVLETAKYYRDKLGFDISFVWDDPPTYAVVKREDAVGIHLVKKQDNYAPSKTHIALRVFVRNVNELYKEYIDKGVEIIEDIGNRDYGMRDFNIQDPNGYILNFGTGIELLENDKPSS
ncbi:VOC family protein [Fulvivirgaceae bacterium BMA10]|uniref:VOC family protein n=1 Tax=Splendidivirga corallicola TaxID=3051826 RepID=A0ABT8KKU4_9BACT|nr:VOC family protein [Fulvivirgaceae bacterium BMA10]